MIGGEYEFELFEEVVEESVSERRRRRDGAGVMQ